MAGNNLNCANLDFEKKFSTAADKIGEDMDSKEYKYAIDDARKDIINILKDSFFKRVEHVYIIGSFLNKDWCSDKSDIDIIIIDKSFDNYHSIYNKKYMKALIKDISYKIDMFLYSPNAFKMKYNSDKIFRNNIERGFKLF